MSVSEAKLAVSEKTLEGFFARIANNNESLGSIENRMDNLDGRLKGTDSAAGNDPSTAIDPHGILPRLSDVIGDTSGAISRIETILASLEDIA